VETLDTAVRLFSAYTTQTQILVVLLFGAALGAPALLYLGRLKRLTDDPLLHDSELDGRVVSMKLKPVRLMSEEVLPEVQVVIYVNGIEFFIPPSHNETWLRVETDMQDQIIPLPKADMYHIRFELNFRSGKKFEGGPLLVRGIAARSTAQKTSGKTLFRLLTLPIADEYNLYFLDDGSRDTSVKAVIPYEIYAQ
jgi:hypothetical protein